MNSRCVLSAILVFSLAATCLAQDEESKPAELAVLKASLGVWDAKFEVWPQGLDKPSVTFEGVETNRAYGEYWIASDLDSEFMGQVLKVHSIIGYDLDKKSLVGKVIDNGPYAATMTGTYDKEANSVEWITNVKAPGGQPMVQKTVIAQDSPDQRTLVLSTPGEDEGEFNKFMEIKFTKRTEEAKSDASDGEK